MIMASVRNFAATSQAFAATHTVMAQRMTRAEVILAQIQEHLGLPPIMLTPPIVVAPTSLAVSQAAASADPAPTASAVQALTVPPAASTALPIDHPTVPTQSRDGDEVPPPAAT